MQLLTTYIRLHVTVFLTVSVLIKTCKAGISEPLSLSSANAGATSAFSDRHLFAQLSSHQQHHNPAVSSSGGGSSNPLSAVSCPLKNVTETKGWGVKSCAASCTRDEDCDGSGYKCSCDGPCGLTCIPFTEEPLYCGFPGRIENGHVLVVGKLGLYDYRNQLKRFSHNKKIIFECDRDFNLAHGPNGKTCRDGIWLPIADNPQCVESDGPGFRWMRSARRKRKAIKTRGGAIVHTNRGGGGAGAVPRRPRKNGRQPGDDEDTSYGPMSCPDLDHDEFMLVEVIKNGDDANNTYSEGSLAKVSCKPGFGVNLYNETVICERGRWRPKLPQCSALPCHVPYVSKGTFYVGSKPLFFRELKPNEIKIELRCSKGYMVKGPNKLQCEYGEWNAGDAPECVPGGCRIPHLDKGMYLLNYKPDMIVASGTKEVDFVCDENYQKPHSGTTLCDYGEWKPTSPKCIHNDLASHRNFSLDNTPIRKSCGSPPKEQLAIAYKEGIPIEFNSIRKFPHGAEVMYRCAVLRPKTKNRWKITCNDGVWNKTVSSYNITCEGNVTDADIKEAYSVTQLMNSSCIYERTDKNVVTFHNEQEIVEEQAEYSIGTVLVAYLHENISRCIDIGKFELEGSQRRKCVSGQWMGLSPKCMGLSQYNDYALDKKPTILFRYVNGSIAQTIEGKLIVYPGTTLHMECIYLRKFGRPAWEVSHNHRTYAEGWTDGIKDRDPTLEYRLTIDNATEKDSGIYSCSTPPRHSHQINIIVKKINCQPLPIREDLIYSTNSTAAGTRVTFSCRDGNSLVGNKDIQCQATSTWNGGLPRCENVECPDIGIVPAMAPLANTDITRNGTLKRNETAPPKVTVLNRSVGGKVKFTCPQGFLVEGDSEAICQINGEWSNAMPLCKEVECKAPPQPENGFVKGTPPYKAGDLAEIECNREYMMEGQSIIACQDNGKWSRPSVTTKCLPACTYPGTTIGGKISEVKFLYAIGESVEFSCDDAYQLVGETELRCQKTAKWSHDVPKCVPKSGDGTYSRYLGITYSGKSNSGQI